MQPSIANTPERIPAKLTIQTIRMTSENKTCRVLEAIPQKYRVKIVKFISICKLNDSAR